MGFLDDLQSAHWRNQAIKDRAAGKSGTFSDALANTFARSSASDEARKVMGAAVQDLSDQLRQHSEDLEEQRRRHARQEAEAAARQREKELAIEAERTQALQGCIDTVERAKQLLTHWSSAGPSKESALELALRVESAKDALKQYGISDANTVRDVASVRAQLRSVLEQHGWREDADGMRAKLSGFLVACAKTAHDLVPCVDPQPDSFASRDGKALYSAGALAFTKAILLDSIADSERALSELRRVAGELLAEGHLERTASGKLRLGQLFGAFDGVRFEDGSNRPFDQSMPAQAFDAALEIIGHNEADFKVLMAALRQRVEERFSPLERKHSEHLQILRDSEDKYEAYRRLGQQDVRFGDIDELLKNAGADAAKGKVSNLTEKIGAALAFGLPGAAVLLTKVVPDVSVFPVLALIIIGLVSGGVFLVAGRKDRKISLRDEVRSFADRLERDLARIRQEVTTDAGREAHMDALAREDDEHRSAEFAGVGRSWAEIAPGLKNVLLVSAVLVVAAVAGSMAWERFGSSDEESPPEAEAISQQIEPPAAAEAVPPQETSGDAADRDLVALPFVEAETGRLRIEQGDALSRLYLGKTIGELRPILVSEGWEQANYGTEGACGFAFKSPAPDFVLFVGVECADPPSDQMKITQVLIAANRDGKACAYSKSSQEACTDTPYMPAPAEPVAAEPPQPIEARKEAPASVPENESPTAQVAPAVAPVVVPPTIRRSTTPEYPPADRRAGNQGRVVLECYVDESGRVGEVRVAESSGHETLDAAAVREVQRNWRFVPGTKDGQPEGMWHTFSLTFTLGP